MEKGGLKFKEMTEQVIVKFEEEQKPLQTKELSQSTELQKLWNNMIEHIQIAELLWKTRLMEVPSITIDIEGVGIPKIYSSYRLSQFNNFLPRLISYARGVGGFEKMKVKF